MTNPFFVAFVDKEDYRGGNRVKKDDDSGEDGLAGGASGVSQLGGARARRGRREALGGNGLVWGGASLAGGDKRHGGEEEDGGSVTQ